MEDLKIVNYTEIVYVAAEVVLNGDDRIIVSKTTDDTRCPIHIMLFLSCPPPSCLPYVASFSGLVFFDCPFGILLYLLSQHQFIVKKQLTG